MDLIKSLGTIEQITMSAGLALESGLLTSDPMCGWFADWAQKRPHDHVYLYKFGGFYGGFIYGESANYETLVEFAQCADDAASKVWSELQSEE